METGPLTLLIRLLITKPSRRLKAETASLKEAIAAREAEATQLGELRDKDYDKALGKAKGATITLPKLLPVAG